MKLQRVDYESGHWIEDNHVGDYDFHCPAAGRLAFVHMGQVASLSLSFCKSCGKMIGNIKSGTPYEWDAE